MRRLCCLTLVCLLAACAPATAVAPTPAPPTLTPAATATPRPPTATVLPTVTPDLGPTAVSTPDRVAGWRSDLATMAKAMQTSHPDLFWRTGQAEFDAAVSRLDAAIPELTDEQVIVELSRLLSVADGHSFIPLFQEAIDFRLYPLRFYLFSDGLYLVRGSGPAAGLVGSRVVQIGRTTVEEAYAAVAPILPHDNEMTVKLLAPVYLNVPEVLLALGIIDDAAAPGYVLERPDGTRTTLNLEPTSSQRYRDWLSTHLVLAGIPGSTDPEELWLNRKAEYFWFTHLEDSNTLYIQYNLVMDRTVAGLSIQEFAQQVNAFANEHQVARTIVDVRHNLGGNNSAPLETVLKTNPHINQPGQLYVLMGRNTFSAAIKFLVNLEKDTHAIFVGESTGGRPNFYAGQETTRLRYSGIEALISRTLWRNTTPDDVRPWLEPHLPVELSSADYFAGRDPVLAAALAAGEEP